MCHEAVHGKAALLSGPAEFIQIQNELLGKEQAFYFWGYPPTYLLVLAPLGVLSYRTAFLSYEVVTLLGLSFPQIVGGALVVEILFNIQGMGWQIWQAAVNHDFPVTLGFTLVIGVAAAIGSLLADIGYAALDPRVRNARR